MIAGKWKTTRTTTTKNNTASFAPPFSLIVFDLWGIPTVHSTNSKTKIFSKSESLCSQCSSRWHRSNHRQGIIFSVTKQKIRKWPKMGHRWLRYLPLRLRDIQKRKKIMGLRWDPCFAPKETPTSNALKRSRNASYWTSIPLTPLISQSSLLAIVLLIMKSLLLLRKARFGFLITHPFQWFSLFCDGFTFLYILGVFGFGC